MVEATLPYHLAFASFALVNERARIDADFTDSIRLLNGTRFFHRMLELALLLDACFAGLFRDSVHTSDLDFCLRNMV